MKLCANCRDKAVICKESTKELPYEIIPYIVVRIEWS